MLPKDCKIMVEEVCFDGLIRPRFFFSVSVESKDLGITVTRYVLGTHWFLNFRLRRALVNCIKMLGEYQDFSGN